MKKQWPIWVFSIIVIMIVFFAFNYQGGEEGVPLSEIFQEEKQDDAVEVKYVYVDQKGQKEKITSEWVEDEDPSQQSADYKLQEKPAPNVSEAKVSEKAEFSPASYSIQVSSYKEKATAQRALERIQKNGHEAYLVSKDLKEKGVWHRIYIGRFATRSSAEEFMQKIKEEFAHCFVIATKE